MNTPMENMDLALMFGFNNETKMGYWMNLNLYQKKSLWPRLPDATRQYLFENLPQEELDILMACVMSHEEVEEMTENI